MLADKFCINELDFSASSQRAIVSHLEQDDGFENNF